MKSKTSTPDPDQELTKSSPASAGKGNPMGGFWSKLGEQIKKVQQPWAWGEEPMELRQTILDEVEKEIVSLGAGQRLFPHQRLKIHLWAPDAKEQTILRAVFEEGWKADQEITEFLRERDCKVGKLEVTIVYDARRTKAYQERRCYVEFAGTGQSLVEAPAPVPGRPYLRLVTVRGETEQPSYEFPKGKRWTIGRLPLVLDEHGRARRKNDIAFGEGDDDSRSVSREHARLEYREESRAFFLIDERSAQGTRIFRDGRAIEVASRNREGLMLRDGDELHFGRAAMSCEMADPRSADTD